MPAELTDGQRGRFEERFRRNLDGVLNADQIDKGNNASPCISHLAIIANKKRSFLERISPLRAPSFCGNEKP
jgi:hypothetical protein